MEGNDIESLMSIDWTRFDFDVNRVVFLYYLNSSYLHFKDLNLLSSANMHEGKKAKDSLMKETKD